MDHGRAETHLSDRFRAGPDFGATKPDNPVDADVKLDCRGADPLAIDRLSEVVAGDYLHFERRLKLERALLSAMTAAGEMQWGKDDCALWCANILKDALGYDGAERFRGRYRTRIGARRV